MSKFSFAILVGFDAHFLIYYVHHAYLGESFTWDIRSTTLWYSKFAEDAIMHSLPTTNKSLFSRSSLFGSCAS